MEHLDQHLKDSVARAADAIAYTFQDRRIDYRTFDLEVQDVAVSLLRLGFKKGEGMALILPNSDAFLTLYHAALRIGMYCVPMNPLYTPSELLYMIRDSSVGCIAAPAQMAPLAPAILSEAPDVKLIMVGDGAHAEADRIHRYLSLFRHQVEDDRSFTQEIEGIARDPDDLAVILYTSGTTGKPKGAMLTHANLASNAMMIGDYLKYTANDRILTVLPMFHVFCLTVCVNAAIYRGAEMIILPHFSPTELIELIPARRATIFAGVPTMYNFLLQASQSREVDFSTLRYCISGGAAMPVALLSAFEARMGVTVLEGYGLSEASPVSAFAPIDGRPRKVGSIGVTLPGIEQKVVDEFDREVDVDEVGELVMRGPNVMKGYWHLPDATAQALRGGWLHTGDMARVDEDGYFYLVDRKKDMIIVGGFNVYPREIEEVLYRCEGVREAAVIGVPDDAYGEVPIAFVVPGSDTLSQEDVKVFCAAHLAKYKQPARVVFIKELPKNTVGKIMRRDLRQFA
ncbi:long-chain-fatty-acid--CoA ligase [Ferroacidibacillus organovorans]|uniref:Long-chain fatty acid--CoA ligase n=1 Tax=Ferroacidibacillus organovorans TaxID=1765683 RepID=A0A1V4EU30_9BACL|nr:long-chain-fatty-acid--CoA ligase [Ferroacidibacillus organovorans]OPG16340.1 hypothetical protein B2M26_05505 [Ferroacidibacillus organovorans]